MIDDRKQREKDFHDERFSGDDKIRKNASKYYSITQESSSFYKNLILRYCENKQLLEYGCGAGSNTIFWVQNRAIVTSIDISTEGIKKAKENVLKKGVYADFFVMDAENLKFESNSFDIVVGTGILHHLDLSKSFSELSRVLREDGHAIFYEPLGHNIFINLYRKITPVMRTVDEQPFLMKDIELAKEYFMNVEATFFNLFTLLAVPFRNGRFFKFFLGFLRLIDKNLIFFFPFVKKYTWIVILDLSKPRKI
ncbi:MAG: class I SAM-dependent methyltransferase [Candidatus Latescibacteria bacterium]|jgi:SAM-dependent methyltransferase|nr:class I SAM-dependent methyltransferase [Desulfobacteraceae bacterium]MBT4484858.1 class I SAM-dependent methyltransferase [Candidatus Latescibacterota bacterium]